MCSDGLPLGDLQAPVKVRARSRLARPRTMWPVSHALLVLVSEKNELTAGELRAPRRVLEQHKRVQRRPAQSGWRCSRGSAVDHLTSRPALRTDETTSRIA